VLKAFWSRLSFRVRLFFGVAQLPTMDEIMRRTLRHPDMMRNIMKHNVFFQHMARKG